MVFVAEHSDITLVWPPRRPCVAISTIASWRIGFSIPTVMESFDDANANALTGIVEIS
jgi:hypothetical protein